MDRPRPARPRSPPWDTQRPYLTGAFLTGAPAAAPAPLSSHPRNVQHKRAAGDALDALLALRPSFAAVRGGDPPTFAPAPAAAAAAAHPEVAPLLARVLPLASDHVAVAAFVERARLPHRATGHVLQAVAAALDALLREYRELVLRLEDALLADALPLQKLLYYVQPSARSMALLRDVAHALRPARGGAALHAVYDLAVSHVGTPDARAVLAFVLAHAAAPVLDALHIWLRTGLVHDPYDEFFIVHNPRVPAANSWEMRYTVNWDNLPHFLAPFVEKVLRAGKYLNVLRECRVDTDLALADADRERHRHRQAPLEQPPDLRLVADSLLAPDASRKIGRIVDRAYALSSSALMAYLNKTLRIRERLRCLRRFFLLQQGDYLVHFFDAAAAELCKPRDEVSRSKLSSLLDLSIRTSVSAADPFQDDLRCVLCHDDLASQISVVDAANNLAAGTSSQQPAQPQPISGYESFALDYQLHWPVNLIVTEMDVLKYQFMFRYLFYCKHVERELEECWRHHSQAKGALRNLPNSFVRSFALRNRMMQFVRNMLYYTVADVLEPNWTTLETAMRKADTIDEIMQHHATFLDNSISQSLLSNEKHLRVFKSISETCLSFSAYTELFSDMFAKQQSAEQLEGELRERNYTATLARFETSFDAHLGKLLDGLSAVSQKRANVHLANLCDRLDASGYYGRFKERSLASFGSLAI